ncbi:hypothetical protein DPM18_02155 [Polynucleobacter paneuropaeus]|uniref:hypothetical protein n=1 Tax=Polynucleobacter paneuropaeus TaxID=2527775 RepID=UPI000DBEFF44|nr:hypothetical protein [Polynucleobacter paneuropaeus]AWW45716.1 hypothetical protein DPM18_02155 [Polynucleobacter paneuropaeus]
MIDAIFSLILNFALTLFSMGFDLIIWFFKLIAIIFVVYWIGKILGINAYFSDVWRGLKHVFRTKD